MKNNPNRKPRLNRKIYRGFLYLYEQGDGEKFHDQTKGYKFGCDNFYVCTISEYNRSAQVVCAFIHIIVIFSFSNMRHTLDI